MPRPLLPVLLLALAPAAPAEVPAAPAEAQDGRALLERALELGDRAPSELHYRIAAPRDAEAFARLKEALAPLRDPGTLRAGYGACAVFRGAAIEVSVRNWLARQAFRAGSAAEQVAAVEALTYYWRDAGDELLRVLRGHSLRECRELALEPLLPRLVAAGDRESCRLVLENLDTRGWRRSALLGAVARFDDLEAEAAMASVLRAPGSSRALKLLLLDAFGERESEVARTAIERRLEDADDRVRLRALQLVAARRDPADHERLERLALAGAPDFALEAMLAIAEARSGDEQFLLELYAHTQSQEEIARRAAAAALSRIPTRDALSLLHRLLRDAELEVRLEALEGLERLRQPASIPRLIDSLGGPRELFTHRAVRVLRMITGEDHGVSRERWQAWFEREGSAFQPPTLAEARRREAERLARRDPGSGGTSASFYGLPVEGTRVTFVLDVSGSMDELASGRGTTAGRRSTRLEVARTEVAASLDQLLDGVRFNLITFASDVRALAPKLLELGPRSRAKARDAVGSWRAGGGTALFDGLRRALAEPDVEEVFLLTDGVPTEGEAVEEDDILARVQELVGGRGVKIHGVAIGQRSGLLRRLAQATGGHYTEIR
jgi:HEAT repeat protein